MYVWSDTDQKYPETRIIFLDTEKSNWTWDPVANAFFWHRFYAHQPDLNFDNPRVLEEVLKVMRMWLDMGVDGLRLDAIPYLVEREGTNNENLPETHDVLKAIRAELDRHYPDRMLLAEANQWPEDTRPYFGEGDECHMGFHFPLMPRMYMALAQDDRHPITDIIRQTPEIPDNCQWAIFLRNHDELTLEMVTEDERDYLWKFYAEDARARINLGIRRRLAPLMKNDRRKIELLNSHAASRCPARRSSTTATRSAWATTTISATATACARRCSGRPTATPASAAPTRSSSTCRRSSTRSTATRRSTSRRRRATPPRCCNWMRRMIAVRKQHPAFGRGSMTLIYPRNRKVLAYLREHEGDRILCVANLADSAQAVELDLARFRGMVPIELTGRSAFPPIGDLPYLLTLPAYGFFWFLLTDEEQAPSWHAVDARDPARVHHPHLPRRPHRHRAHRPRAQSARDRGAAAVPAAAALVRRQGRAHRQGRDHRRSASSARASSPSPRSTSPWATTSQRYFLPISARWGDAEPAPGRPEALLHARADPPRPARRRPDRRRLRRAPGRSGCSRRCGRAARSTAPPARCACTPPRPSPRSGISATRARSASSRATSRSPSATR